MKSILSRSLILFIFCLSVLTTPAIAKDTDAEQLDKAKDAIHTKDYATALKILKPLAQKGNAFAQNNVGNLYAAESNFSEALKWYTLAAKQGATHAQINIGNMYKDGYGVKEDEKEALKWYTAAAEHGDTEGQISIGDLYYQKKDPNPDEAIARYKLAAKLGNPYGYFKIGDMYNDGLRVKKDENEAIKWYLLAANEGDDWAQDRLGAFYIGGINKEHQNYAEALKWYTLSAKQGNASGLGRMYKDGNGVEKDYVLAYAWLNIALKIGQNYLVESDIASLKEIMTPSDITKAEAKFQELKKTIVMPKRNEDWSMYNFFSF